jgi:hypothetical protein
MILPDNMDTMSVTQAAEWLSEVEAFAGRRMTELYVATKANADEETLGQLRQQADIAAEAVLDARAKALAARRRLLAGLKVGP